MRGVCALSVLLASCSADARVTVALPPAPEGMRSAFVMVAGEERLSTFALDARAPAGPLIVELVGDASLTVAYYRASLRRFGLEPGPVQLSAGALSFAAPPPDAARATETADALLAPWRDGAARAALEQLRLPSMFDPCRPWNVRIVELPGQVRAAAAVDAETALITTTEGPFYTMSRGEDAPRPVSVAEGTPRALAHHDALGRSFVFGSGGAVARYHAEERTLEALPPTDPPVWFDEADDGLPDPAGRFWALDRSGTIALLEDGRIVEHHALAVPAEGIGEVESAVVTAGGDDEDHAVIAVYEPGRAPRVLPPSGMFSVGSARTVPELGLVLGGADGVLYGFRPPNTVEPLPSSTDVHPNFEITGIATVDDELVLSAGLMGRYVVGHGYCPPVELFDYVGEVVPVGDGALAFRRADTRIAWLTP